MRPGRHSEKKLCIAILYTRTHHAYLTAVRSGVQCSLVALTHVSKQIWHTEPMCKPRCSTLGRLKDWHRLAMMVNGRE